MLRVASSGNSRSAVCAQRTVASKPVHARIQPRPGVSTLLIQLPGTCREGGSRPLLIAVGRCSIRHLHVAAGGSMKLVDSSGTSGMHVQSCSISSRYVANRYAALDSIR